MAAAIVQEFRGPVKTAHPVESVELIPSGGGVFDVEVDGDLIFSKHQAGRHAVGSEVVEAIRAKRSSML